ncbi:MAG TPA: O-antigen ligase family protein [Terriglobales bacterium]|jgi:O-antigen ligase
MIFALLAAAIFLGLIWPMALSLGGFAFSVPFDQISALDSSGHGLAATYLVAGTAIAVMLCAGLMFRGLDVPESAALRWGALTAWATLSVAWAQDASVALERMPTVVALYALYVVACCTRFRPSEVSVIVRATVLGGVAAAAYALWQYQSGIAYHDSARASLVVGERATDPNVFAASLLLPFCLALAAVFADTRRTRQAVMAAAVLLIASGIAVTMSRGALLAVCVIVLVFAWRLRWGFKTLVPFAAVACLLPWLPDLFLTRLRGALDTGGAGRLSIWEAGLNAFFHYGWRGAGLDNFESVFPAFAGKGQNFVGLARDAHNIYLALGVELGIVGIVLFAIALRAQLEMVAEARQFAWDKKGYTQAVACEAALWGMLTASFFLNMMWKKPLWLCLILCSLVAKESRRALHEHRALLCSEIPELCEPDDAYAFTAESK